MRVRVASSQLYLPSLTPLSVAGRGLLQLGVLHWATSVDYCKQLIIDPTSVVVDSPLGGSRPQKTFPFLYPDNHPPQRAVIGFDRNCQYILKYIVICYIVSASNSLRYMKAIYFIWLLQTQLGLVLFKFRGFHIAFVLHCCMQKDEQ